MTLAEAQAIGAEYGLDILQVEALSAGSVNSNFRLRTRSGDAFFLRVYEEQAFDGAAQELELVTELHRLGVPTPTPLARLAGGFTARHSGKPVGVVPWLQGEILCSARVTPDSARRLGHALAEVHVASARLSRIPRGRFGVSDLLGRLDHIERTAPAHAADAAFIRERLARYSEATTARSGAPANAAELPAGLIHGDLFRDNVLFRGRDLIALLDFESASAGAFIYDLMVCIHAWCYRDGFELELVAALLSGYGEVRRIERSERAAAKAQGALAALRFATTRITDFALRAPPGQPPLRDYRRFLSRLQAIEAGVLDGIIERGET